MTRARIMRFALVVSVAAVAAVASAQPSGGSAGSAGSNAGSANGGGSNLGSAGSNGTGSNLGSNHVGSGSNAIVIIIPPDTEPPEVTAAASPTDIKLGDRFTLFVTATYQVGVEVNLREPTVTTHRWDDDRLAAVRDQLRLSIRAMRAYLADPHANLALIDGFERTEELRICRWCNFRAVCRPEIGASEHAAAALDRSAAHS